MQDPVTGDWRPVGDMQCPGPSPLMLLRRMREAGRGHSHSRHTRSAGAHFAFDVAPVTSRRVDTTSCGLGVSRPRFRVHSFVSWHAMNGYPLDCPGPSTHRATRPYSPGPGGGQGQRHCSLNAASCS
jgi:hypothetical protein